MELGATDGGLFGNCIGGPAIPANIDHIVINPAAIADWAANRISNPANWPLAEQRTKQCAVAHELAHGVSITHHANFGVSECIMKYPWGEEILDPTQHCIYCLPPERGEIVNDMRLRNGG